MSNSTSSPEVVVPTYTSAADQALIAGLRDTLGAPLVNRILQSKLLLVGAGGIGCELLKNLALCGFRKVHVIDLDTIDVSNLNRQLLFRSQHVGQPKCTVACQVAQDQLAVNGTEYKARHGNVCDNDVLNVQFVAQFDLVLNALDNVVARRRVNRLCLAAGKRDNNTSSSTPLVEAGTTGYLGQVNVIDKASGVACYECQTQEAPKVYPICTIRSTPSMPVHTIVWAKELYKLCFGEKVEESMLYEDATEKTEANGNAETLTENGTNENGNLAEPSTYMADLYHYRKLFAGSRNNSNTNHDHAALRLAATTLITKLYVDEIQKQLDMDRYKAARKTPVPLDRCDIDTSSTFEYLAQLPHAQDNVQAVWTKQECIAHLVACLLGPSVENEEDRAVLPAFDKDDDFGMRFVTAASNLRSYVFGIEPIQSLYAAKGIAGNIIPAIATTNAICAGLQILQVFKILQKQMENEERDADSVGAPDGAKVAGLRDCCNYINCLRNPTRNGLYIMSTKLEPPNPQCFVCARAVIALSLNLDHWTLQQFIDTIVKKDLGFEQPTINLGEDGECTIWEEGEDADDTFVPNLPKRLRDLPGGGVQHGTSIHIEDFSQELSVEVAVTHQTTWPRPTKGTDEEDPLGEEDLTHRYVIGGTKPQAAEMKSAAVNGNKEIAQDGVASKPPTESNANDDDDVVEVVSAYRSRKGEKRSVIENGADEKKRAAKRARTDNQEVIEID